MVRETDSTTSSDEVSTEVSTTSSDEVSKPVTVYRRYEFDDIKPWMSFSGDSEGEECAPLYCTCYCACCYCDFCEKKLGIENDENEPENESENEPENESENGSDFDDPYDGDCEDNAD